MNNSKSKPNDKVVLSFEERLLRTIASLKNSIGNMASFVTFTNLFNNGGVGTGANQVAFGNHTHDFILGDQNLDGGSSSSIYTSNELFDGGTA